MRIDIQKTEEESRWLRHGAWVVLLVGMALSVAGWWRASDQLQKSADRSFVQQSADVNLQVDQLVDHYLDVLRSFQAMYMVSDKVSRDSFHRNYLNLNIAGEYPALQAVEFAPYLSDEQKAAFESAVRGDRSVAPSGYPHYRIQPEGQRAEYVPLMYAEPLAAHQNLPGTDLAFDPAQREVMERARDTARPQVSAPLLLPQAGKSPGKTGIVIRLPIYKPGAHTDSTEARRQAFVGLVSGAIEVAGIMGEVTKQKDWRHLQWRIDDMGSELDPDQADAQALFDTAKHIDKGFRSTGKPNAVDEQKHAMDVGGRHWVLRFTREPVDAMTQPYPLALLLGGMVASLGLWWALRGSAVRQAQAAALAMTLSQKARDSESRLRAVLDNTVDGLVTMTPSGRLLSINRAVSMIFGYDEDDMVGQHFGKLLPAANAGQDIESFLKAQRVGLDGVSHRTEGRRANGGTFPLDLAMSSMTLNGHVQHIGVMRDLSARDSAERAIVQAQRQLNEVDEMRRVIVHNAPYAIFVLNAQGIIQTVNPAGEKLVGYRAQELVGRCTTQRFFDADQVADRARMLALRMNESVRELDVLTHLANESPGLPSEWTLRRSDGSYLVAEITVTQLNNEYGQANGYLAMAYDVTSRRDAEHQLQHMAQHDALTALPNRNMLQDQLKTCMVLAERYGHNMALMFLDVDRFKKINDGLGHHVGDAVLVEIARRLRAGMRTSDIVARLGGDEFVILLPQINSDGDGERVAQKVLDLFVDPLIIDQHELRITPSIGLALYPEHGKDTVTLMRHADLAMYQAKNNGRNRIQVYSDQMQSPTAETLVLENDLYKALERDELRLHFQPQFDCTTGHITGAEALLRWQHGDRLVPPSDFIPMAEETGLIVAMGEWVLRRACVMAQQWRERSGWDLRVAVNLSAVQLDKQDIPALVAQVLKETGLPATALELEITESVVVRESLRAADILTQLRAQGVGIAIDDFGVGYSSFAYLRELPVDRFKLDRSFLTSVPDSPGDSRLVAALIAMGHRLDVGIVAEGVETPEQAAFLTAHGCDEAQGYHLGRPMNEEAFETLLMVHSREQFAKGHQVISRKASAKEPIHAATSTVTTVV